MRAALLDGIVLGLQYGLLGVGLTLIYGLAGVLNLAHGQVAVLGAIVVSLLMADGVPVVVAAAIGIAAAAAFMVLLDLSLMRAVYRQHGEQRILLGLLLMLGVSFAVEGFLTWQYPVQQLSIRISGEAVPILGVPMPVGALVASCVAVAAALLLAAFFRMTVLGRGVRSVIQDEAGARLCGVNPSAARRLVFGLSGALACLVAVTRSMTGPIGYGNAIAFTLAEAGAARLRPDPDRGRLAGARATPLPRVAAHDACDHGRNVVRCVRGRVQRHLRQHRATLPLHWRARRRWRLHVGNLRRPRRAPRGGEHRGRRRDRDRDRRPAELDLGEARARHDLRR